MRCPKVFRWGRVAVVATVVASLGAAACGGSGSGTAASTTAETPVTATTSSTSAAVSPTSTSSTPATVSGRPVRVMPLGDSFTQGSDATKADSSQSYRGYLYTRLRAAGYDVDFVGSDKTVPVGGGDADNEGHGGFTIGPDQSVLCTGCGPANLAANIDEWLAAAQPDVVLLLIGVNDMLPEPKQPSGFVRPVEPADAAKKLTALIDRIRASGPDRRVLVSSYPPIGFLLDPNLSSTVPFRALVDAAKQAAANAPGRVTYVDVQGRLTGSWGSGDLAADGFHPSPAGAKKIADLWFESLTPVLDDLTKSR